jgi:hypothetical protein
VQGLTGGADAARQLIEPTNSHTLGGARLKVARAEAEIAALRRAEEAFRGAADYEALRAEIQPQPGHHVYRVHKKQAPELGLDWGVTIGEIAHNLRSARDNLAWQLALLTTDTPYERTQFPIFDVARQRIPTKGGRTREIGFEIDGRPMIRNLRPEHQAAIEALQPYRPGCGGKEGPLSQLAHINNADKHRVVQVVAAQTGAFSYGSWGDIDPVQAGEVSPTPLPVLEEGAEVIRAGPNVQVGPKLFPLVAFSKGCPEVEGLGVCFRLDRIAQHVSGIIESCGSEFG